MNAPDKPLGWLHGEIRTPPFSKAARLEAGYLLRKLQRGEQILLPHSRPMPSIGAHCHELRIIYRIDPDAIIIAEVFEKKSARTPRRVIDLCQQRLLRYDTLSK